jgi:hypothetical protein
MASSGLNRRTVVDERISFFFYKVYLVVLGAVGQEYKLIKPATIKENIRKLTLLGHSNALRVARLRKDKHDSI